MELCYFKKITFRNVHTSTIRPCGYWPAKPAISTIEFLARGKSVHASPVKQLGFCLSTGCENKICKFYIYLGFFTQTRIPYKRYVGGFARLTVYTENVCVTYCTALKLATI